MAQFVPEEVRALIPTPGTVVVKDAERGATAFIGDDAWFVTADVLEQSPTARVRDGRGPAGLLGARIIAILRGVPLQEAMAIAERTWDTGIGAVEVPLQDAASADVLASLADRATERGEIVGAGTITTVDRFDRRCRSASPSQWRRAHIRQ